MNLAAVGLSLGGLVVPSPVVESQAVCSPRVSAWTSSPGSVKVGYQYIAGIKVTCSGQPVGSATITFTDYNSSMSAVSHVNWITSAVGNAAPTLTAKNPVGTHYIGATYASTKKTFSVVK